MPTRREISPYIGQLYQRSELSDENIFINTERDQKDQKSKNSYLSRRSKSTAQKVFKVDKCKNQKPRRTLSVPERNLEESKYHIESENWRGNSKRHKRDIKMEEKEKEENNLNTNLDELRKPKFFDKPDTFWK